MKRSIQTVILIAICLNLRAQENKPLRQNLMEQVKSCKSMIEDWDNDGKRDFGEFIYDSESEYIRVSGSFPTCGCNCTSAARAYQTATKRRVYVSSFDWDCIWKKGISSTEKLDNLFPFDLEAIVFDTAVKQLKSANAFYYFDLSIPRKGSEIIANIRLIPLGIKMPSAQRIVYEYSESSRFDYSGRLFEIRSIIPNINSEEILKSLVSGKLLSLSSKEANRFKKLLEDNDITQSELAETLDEIKKVYDLSRTLKYYTLILEWDVERARFHIKEKQTKEEETFLEFLKNSPKWMAMC